MHRVLCSGGPCGRPHPEWPNVSYLPMRRTPNGPMPPVLKSRELFSGRSEKRWYLSDKRANFACVRQELCQND